MRIKKILLMVAAFAMISSANAQETKIGVKAGLNLATIASDLEELNMKLGFHIGFVANFIITDRFALVPEFLFSIQGAKADGESFNGITIAETTRNFTYINVPVLAKVYVTEGLNIHAGPYIGMLLGARLKTGEGGDADIKDGYKPTDFGVAAGLGYDLPAGLAFGARYNAGLSNIADLDEVAYNIKMRNQVIQIYVGFNF